MKNTMGIILTGGKNNRLKELSLTRSIAAVPFGGKYRAIDFVLSSMINSGITKVGVLTQYNLRSLMDHLGSGKEWDLDRKNNGLFVFPAYLSETGSGWYKGSADAIYNNLTFLKRSDEEFVVIAQGYAIFNMSFTPLIKYHIETDADVTIACKYMNDMTKEELSHLGIINTDDTGRVVDFQEKPLNPKNNYTSMGIYIMRRKFLISLLEDSAAHGYYEIVKDIFVKNASKLRIYAYNFEGYWRPLSTIQLYYHANLELLNPEIRHKLFSSNGKVFTKVKDETPAKYNEEADVSNSIIADGCVIDGKVENCVLFRGVKIRKGAYVKNSIIMQDSEVHQNASLDCAILDKNVIISEGKNINGDINWPLIVSKGVIV